MFWPPHLFSETVREAKNIFLNADTETSLLIFSILACTGIGRLCGLLVRAKDWEPGGSWVPMRG